jgi:hypothetical protein
MRQATSFEETSVLLERSEPARTSVRVMLVAAGVVHFLWGLALAQLEPGGVHGPRERAAILVLAAGLCGLSFLPRWRHHLLRSIQILAVVGLVHVYSLAARNHLGMTYMASIIVVVAVSLPVFTEIRAAIFYGSLVLSGAAVVGLLSPEISLGAGLQLVARVAMVLLAAGLAAWRFISFEAAARKALTEKIAQLEAARAEVKQLRGLLPICMHCKKVRDQSNAWHRIEQYIEHHSEAQFSHGVCEACLAEHYPPETDAELPAPAR